MSQMEAEIAIEKEKLRIRKATPEDAATLSRWWNDGAIMAHAGFPHGLGIREQEVVDLIRKDGRFHCRLILEFEDIPIGEMNYRTVAEKTAEIGIKICAADMQNKGYGPTYIKMLMQYLFLDRHYDSIRLDTNLQNERAQHVYEKLGFIKIRTNMDSWRNQVGELQSSIDYEITKEKFLELHC